MDSAIGVYFRYQGKDSIKQHNQSAVLKPDSDCVMFDNKTAVL